MAETKTAPKSKEKSKAPAKKEAAFTIVLHNKKGEATDSNIELPKEIFGAKDNPSLLVQATRIYLANSKLSLSSTKTRSEVAGGGKKPWKQKGTGRARAGTIRASQWRGGGVVFGPTPNDSQMVLPRKMRQKALSVALSGKYSEKALVIVDKLDFKEPQTKAASEMIEKFPLSKNRNLLIILNNEETNAIKSVRNLKNVKITSTVDLNALNVLKSSGLIFTVDSLEKLRERFFIEERKR